MKATPPGTDPLARLHDVVTPPAVPYAPQTVGWYLLAAALVLLLAWLGVRAWRRTRANRYRKAALREIDRIEAELQADPDRRGEAVAALNELLKRTALSAWPRAEVASLAGGDWLVFLDATGTADELSRGPGRALAEAVYTPPDRAIEPERMAALFAVARSWVRRHRPQSSARDAVSARRVRLDARAGREAA
jgi:hypothetical protein